jgi:hypothetical protein
MELPFDDIEMLADVLEHLASFSHAALAVESLTL